MTKLIAHGPDTLGMKEQGEGYLLNILQHNWPWSQLHDPGLQCLQNPHKSTSTLRNDIKTIKIDPLLPEISYFSAFRTKMTLIFTQIMRPWQSDTKIIEINQQELQHVSLMWVLFGVDSITSTIFRKLILGSNESYWFWKIF